MSQIVDPLRRQCAAGMLLVAIALLAACGSKGAGSGANAPSNPAELAKWETRDLGVKPPDGLHTGAPHGPTPTSLPGGRVITTAELQPLLGAQGGRVLVLDVLGGEQTLPRSFRATPAAAPGDFKDATQQQFAQVLQQITRGDMNVTIVTYCASPECWLSYNAALRAIAAGYKDVRWYRGGLEAWQRAGLPLEGGAGGPAGPGGPNAGPNGPPGPGDAQPPQGPGTGMPPGMGGGMPPGQNAMPPTGPGGAYSNDGGMRDDEGGGGDGGAYAPRPQYPQQGYPEPNAPQQNYPPQGYPQQAYPQPGYPQQNYPQQGYPPQGGPQPQYPQQQYPGS